MSLTFDKVKKAVKSAAFYSVKNQVYNNFKDELNDIVENKVKKNIFLYIKSLASGIKIKYMATYFAYDYFNRTTIENVNLEHAS